MSKLRVALIGFGYWGSNLARNISINQNYEFVAIVDQDEERRELANALYTIPAYSSYEELKDFGKLDLVVISTRPGTHMMIAEYFIAQGTNILVTKPCGISATEASTLDKMAQNFAVKIFCDFTYHFSPLTNFLISNPRAQSVIREMKEYVSYRTALGIIQSDVDVLADLGVHDIYLLLLLKGHLPKTVQCIQINPLVEEQTRSAFFVLTWSDDFVASVHVSWKSAKKIRMITITSNRASIIVEEMIPSAPIQMLSIEPGFDESIDLIGHFKFQRNVSYNTGAAEIPVVEMYEALASEFQSIAQVLKDPAGVNLLPGATVASRVWRVVEALRESVETQGVVQIG
jgi:predicted dehydrogenase